MLDVFGRVAVTELDITLGRFTELTPAEPSDITTNAEHGDPSQPSDIVCPPPNKGKEKALCHTDLSLRALQRYELRSKHDYILKAPPSEDLDFHDRALYVLECYIITGNEVARSDTIFHLRTAPKKPLPVGITRPVLLIELANMGIRLYEKRKEKEVQKMVTDLVCDAQELIGHGVDDANRQEHLSCQLVSTWCARELRLLRSGQQDKLIRVGYLSARMAWEALKPLEDGPIVSAICYIGLAEVFFPMYWALKSWRNLISVDNWATISMDQLSRIPPDHPSFRDCHLSVAAILRNASTVLADGAAELKTDPPLDPIPEGFGVLDWIRPADVPNSNDLSHATIAQYLLARARAKSQSSVDILAQFIEDSECLISSAQSLAEIYKQTHDRTSLLKSVDIYHQCLNVQHGQPKEHMRAAVEVANLLSAHGNRGEHLDVIATLAKAITVTLQLISHNMTVEDQQLNLLAVHGFANTVAALYLRNDHIIEALSVLERGRNLMTNRIIDTRISVDEPGSVEVDDLLSQFRDLQEAVVREIDLDPTDLAFRRRREANPDGEYMMNLEMGWKRFEARDELDKVAEKLRRHPRYADYLDSPSPDIMKGMANDGPIFVVNVTASRCDTIVITATSITSVNLDELQLETVELNRQKMERIVNDEDRSNWAPNNKELSSILLWLWNSVVKPSWKEAKLRHSYTDSSTSAMPRAWWIAGGPLEWAPLHVAGKFDGKPTKNNITKLATSSYTPSIRALRYSRQRERLPKPSGAEQSILVVTMETTPGESPLPGAREEAEVIETRAKEADIPCIPLRQKPANEVLRQIQHHTIVHFACHGIVHRQSPSSSSLLLQRTIDNTYSQQRFGRIVTFTGGAGVGTAGVEVAEKGRLLRTHVFSTYDEQSIPLAAKNGRLVLGTKSTPGYSGLNFDPDNIPTQKDLLSVSDLAALPLKPAFPRHIAFLSACHSAFALSKVAPQGRYLEETISIAAGFHLAGFRHVIGSFWKAKDEACVRISDCFYKTLFENREVDRGIKDSDVARALQIAVLDLIKKEPSQPLLWAPFIHIGT